MDHREEIGLWLSKALPRVFGAASVDREDSARKETLALPLAAGSLSK